MAREEVEEFSKKKAEGAICRSRINWQVHGEKPSRYFCNLEKYNGTQKFIPQLIKHADGNSITLSKTLSFGQTKMKDKQN